MFVELQLSATLENIESFVAEGEDFRWYLKVRLKGLHHWLDSRHKHIYHVLPRPSPQIAIQLVVSCILTPPHPCPHLQVKCCSCGELNPTFVYVAGDESTDVKGGRGQANLVIKCKMCSRENSMSIVGTS